MSEELLESINEEIKIPSIEIISVKKPVQTGENVINCIVEFSHLPGEELEFSATSYDDTEHGKKLWKELIEGKYGEIEIAEERKIGTEEINDYRDNLISEGIIFKGKPFQTRPQDRENIAGASTMAVLAILNGAKKGNYFWHGQNTPFTWICSDNTTIQLDAYDILELGKAIATYKQQCIFCARELKNLIEQGTNIPDFENSLYWPSNSFS